MYSQDCPSAGGTSFPPPSDGKEAPAKTERETPLTGAPCGFSESAMMVAPIVQFQRLTGQVVWLEIEVAIQSEKDGHGRILH